LSFSLLKGLAPLTYPLLVFLFTGVDELSGDPVGGGLVLDQLDDGVNRFEIIDIEVVVLDSYAKFGFYKEYKLHSKKGVDETKGKDVVVVFDFDVLKESGDEGLGFAANGFHVGVPPENGMCFLLKISR